MHEAIDSLAGNVEIINLLPGAIERNEFSARFQPIVDANNGKILGAELLLRWHSPAGEIPPDVFIPLAEMSGDILSIGAWVFRQGCLAEVRWRERWGDDAPYVSINVSTKQLSDAHLMDDFTAILEQTSANPSCILLEVTETSLMTDVEANLRVLHRLVEIGFRIAIDDFGTGYSSLAQLAKMPVDVLKIDRAFVDNIETKKEDLMVTRAVIGLARDFGLKVIAEGVETSGQQSILKINGCDSLQGYLFSIPIEESHFMAYVDSKIDMDCALGQDGHFFVIYVSKATRRIDDAELGDILNNAILFNRLNEITGFLVYQDGYFLQLL
ncbi:MAG: diguanylate cyclase, partial [Acidocella sp. 20-63-7]